jgi:hypothetical protein
MNRKQHYIPQSLLRKFLISPEKDQVYWHKKEKTILSSIIDVFFRKETIMAKKNLNILQTVWYLMERMQSSMNYFHFNKIDLNALAQNPSSFTKSIESYRGIIRI